MAKKLKQGLCRGVGWGGRWEGSPKGRAICMPMADSGRGLTENNKVL